MGSGAEGKVYTLSEVTQHSSREDCWLIINGKPNTCCWLISDNQMVLLAARHATIVQSERWQPAYKVYNVTKFLEDHPGGDEVLLAVTGKDASDDFEDVGHSSTARAMMDEYYVGEIETSTIPAKVKYSPPKQPYYNQDKTSDFIIKILQFLVPLAILGLAVIVRIYTKSA